jgi:hypothetical protein
MAVVDRFSGVRFTYPRAVHHSDPLTVMMVLIVLSASFVLGVVQGTAANDPRSIRVAGAFAVTIGLTIAAVLYTMIGFRRTFLVPAISILEEV